MPRFSAGDRTAAGSTTLPIISIYSGAATTGVIREIGVFNTTATAVELYLCRLTSTGTQGAGLTEARHNPKKVAAACTAHTTHSVLPTLGDDLGYRGVLGAAIGSGVIWTFGDDGLLISAADAVEAVSNGIGVLVENGTGQVCQAYIVWDE
jgi:hypothetical protein